MIIKQIPLTNTPDQKLTTTINGNTLNLTINTKSVNNKRLRGQNADADANTQILTFTNIALGNTPVIQNMISLHAVYLNQYVSDIKGYLFF